MILSHTYNAISHNLYGTETSSTETDDVTN